MVSVDVKSIIKEEKVNAELSPAEVLEVPDIDPTTWAGGESGTMYLTLHCHHHNDSSFRWAAAMTGTSVLQQVGGEIPGS